MIYKISLVISGDNLVPEKVIEGTSKDFIVVSYNSPTDRKFADKEDLYGYGVITFWHTKKFATRENIHTFEGEYVAFIENNFSLFTLNGATDFELYMEVYYDGGQCNFEIFDKDLVARLAKFRISIPVSVYVLSDLELNKWMKEIELTWSASLD
ncbi:hypothetical protein QNI19_18670 [Cytophagaceae bacterium DM2B3-1]|uniref:IPExxxVDY family protein n=1 Tax=Xanthocytophaga flava TaxID=3048013 RepID=A0ABT7CMJ8_9BACT|nr:hypothetical protein [Xanthocytophaga flavus]MDJ1467597.1 hypothetical protein [Xanthocytophaga flavus]MDJ1494969.1 hypothetical protein [Xanthocytophaga flavus]